MFGCTCQVLSSGTDSGPSGVLITVVGQGNYSCFIMQTCTCTCTCTMVLQWCIQDMNEGDAATISRLCESTSAAFATCRPMTHSLAL